MSVQAEKVGRGRKRDKKSRLKAMEHPLRARVLRLLVERGVLSPAQLARLLNADVKEVSYHVRQLEKLDCAELVEERPVRGVVEHFYRATERHLINGDEWEELDPLIADDLVCEFMQQIVGDFKDSHRAGIVGSDQHFHITRTPMILDEEGFLEGMEIFERCRSAMADVEAKCAQRLASSGASPVPVSSSLAYFKVPRMSLRS
ncbi:MAG: winged helix-turn-helix domain-containing protein [Solirubrobacterales bacterium]